MKRLKGLAQWLSLFLLAVAIIAVYKTFDNLVEIGGFFSKLLDILSPFVIGFGMAFLLYGPCSKIEGLFLRSPKPVMQKLARPTAVVIVYLLLFGLLTLIGYLALPALYHAIMDFVSAVPGYYNNVMAFLAEYTKEGGLLEGLHLEERIQDLYAWISSQLTADRIFSYFQGILNFTTSLLDIFMAFIISVYMLLGRESLIRAVKAVAGIVIKPRGIAFCSTYTHKITKIFYSYFYSQAIDACIVGVLATIGLLIARLPNAPVLGMMLGIMNMIPYFGAIIGGVICVLVALLSGNIYGAVFVAIYILAMQQIDGNIIQPRIVSNSVGIKAIYVLLAITVGGGFFGFWGIFLGVPVMAMIQMLVKDFIDYRKRREECKIRAGGEGENRMPFGEDDD